MRLTLLYAAAFFIAGALLVTLMYFYLNQFLDRRPGLAVQDLVHEFLSRRHGAGSPLGEARDLYSALAEQAEQNRRDTLGAMLVWSLVSLGAVGIAACGFGWLLAGRALRPLQRITATARRVADHSLHERIALSGPDDELKQLADTFDAMLERLDRAFDGQQRFVANASHELRTPLTINRTLIEVALDDPEVSESTRRLGRTLLEVNARNERLIDGLLVLAGSEQRLTERSRVDLADIARHTLAGSADAIGEGRVEIHTDLRAAPVLGDPVLLERLTQNLLDNAIRYNRTEAGRIAVVTETVDNRARLIVENSGPVVPSFAVDGLFEPFRRGGDTDRAAAGPPAISGRPRGAGLGLSIVRSVAHAHGGRVGAVARPEGGLTVTLVLPLGATDGRDQ